MLLLISILLIAAYQSIAVAVTAITANMRLALSLGGGYAVMAFTFSGVTFPTIAMYGVAQLFAKAFPLTYYNEIFINQALRGAGVEHSIEDFWALLIFIALGCVVWRRLGRVVRSEEYWRKD
jgi:ABC-2 type transport system permease protein